MHPRSIALDATLWEEPTTGIALYVRSLAEALKQQGCEVALIGARRSGQHRRRLGSRSGFALVELPATLATVRPSLFHAVANFNLPLTRTSGTPYVLTVHDLIPELFPDTVSRAFHWQFRLWLSRSLRVADQIICVSARTRDDLLARHSVDPAKVHVVHSGVDHVDAVPKPDATGEEYLRALGLGKRFVLYAGALEARKNVELVLEACARLHEERQPATLVLAGQRWFGAGKIEARITELRRRGLDIRLLGYLTEPLFYELMRRATVVAFPSRYEGFGLPPLEAMRLGTPAVVSTAGSLPEVCGKGAPAVHPDDVEGMARVLSSLLNSEEERERWKKAALEHTAKMTWKRASEETLAVYDKALGSISASTSVSA
ncbi:MAG: glycosyltransferase family 4 protein [Myxococcaceae bacterium]